MQRNASPLRLSLTLLLLAGLFFGAAGQSLASGGEERPRVAASPGDVVISEFRTRGSAGASDEFIELYNPKGGGIAIGGWELRVLTGTGNEALRATIPDGVVLEPGQHYLIANSTSPGGYSGGSFDLSFSTGIVDNGGIAIFDDNGVKIDSVGMSATSIYRETTFLTPLTGTSNQSYERKPGGVGGSCTDTDNNINDFNDPPVNPSDPQTLSSSPIYCAGVETFTPTNTLLPTDTPTPTFTPTATAPLSLVINEIGWSGTKYSSSDEWIELYNPNSVSIDLSGWRLTTDDGNLDISLSGKTILSGDYFLIGRYSSIFSDVTIDLAYSSSIGKWSSLSNNGSVLRLLDPTGAPVDSANTTSVDGKWLAGSASPNYASMERIGPVLPDGTFSWATFAGTTFVAHDRATPTPNPILGTPGQANWTAGTVTVTPTPSNTPTRTATSTRTLSPTATVPPDNIVITEVAWMGTAASASDEWIELYNNTSKEINLNGWKITTSFGAIDLSGHKIQPNGYFLLESTNDTTISDITADLIFNVKIANNGETLTLYDPLNRVVDTANANGDNWPAGSATTFGSMERAGQMLSDVDTSWFTHAGSNPKWGKDANGDAINGTPKRPNWAYTVTATPSRTPTPAVPRKSVVISEVAWAGTSSSTTSDEWIELYNITLSPISVQNWMIVAGDGDPKIILKCSNPDDCIIPPNGFFLIERTDDNTVKGVDADFIASWNLMSNSGEILLLCDPQNVSLGKCHKNTKNQVVDFANGDGGCWPTFCAAPSAYGSMERRDPRSDEDSIWIYHTGENPQWGHDRNWNGINPNNNKIKDTPGHPNWAYTVTATPRVTPTRTPTRTRTPVPAAAPILEINEILARAGADWNNDGKVDVYDEFIEVINYGTVSLNLSGYRLDDYELDASGKVIANAFTLPSQTLKPGERAVFYGSQTGIHLDDSGDTVRLIHISTNSVIDAQTYPIVKALDWSICRYRDGFVSWVMGCFPTPNLPNQLTGDLPVSTSNGQPLHVCVLADSVPMEFVLAECGENGLGIWNPFYWDSFPGEGNQIWLSDERDKWLVIIQ